MSRNRELNRMLVMREEEQNFHTDYNEEFAFYNYIANGDVEQVRRFMAPPEAENMYDDGRYGMLSSNLLQNIRYHFVVSVAIISRLCVEKGLERELAYTLSDLYISSMDKLNSKRDILMLHNEMLMDFTLKMKELPKRQVYSIQIVRAMNYIFEHRNEAVDATVVALALEVNRSYLSTLFKKETGMGLAGFIRREKIKAAANMIKFSDYSYVEIAQYFAFSNQSHFIQCFKKEMGCTPREYRKENWYRANFPGGVYEQTN